MKHIMGNSPKCSECLHWREPEPWEKCKLDGWCTNKQQLSTDIAGKKRKNPPEKEAVNWHDSCFCWEDAEYPHINHFEAATHKPDPNRSELEQMVIADAIAKAVEEQKDLDEYYRRKKEKKWEQ